MNGSVEKSPLVSVVIVTACESTRADQLRRARDSILSQEGVNSQLIVVVNGQRYDPSLLDELSSDRRLKLYQLEEGNYPAALRFGRQVVSGSYYGFLDDDDIYLPGALNARLTAINQNPAVDFVATNGYREAGGRVNPYTPEEIVKTVDVDPLGAVSKFNWLASCAALFRAATVPVDFFDGVTKHCEWTWLAHQLLIAGRKVHFLDIPTFRVCNSPESLSKVNNIDALTSELRTIQKMIASAPARQQAPLQEKLRGALHNLSVFHLDQHEISAAWSYHFQSLRRRNGWRHLGYTRWLIMASTRRSLK